MRKLVALALAISGLLAPAVAAPLNASEAAWLLLLQGDFEKADELARQALAAKPNHARFAWILSECATDEIGRTEIGTYFSTLLENEKSSGGACIGLGNLAFHGDRFDAADSLFSIARTFYRAAGDSAGVMVATERLGLLLQEQNSYPASLPCFTATLTHFKSTGASVATALSHHGLARIHTFGGNTDKAITHLDQMLTIVTDLGIHNWAGEAWIHLSVLARWKMDLDESMRCRENALTEYIAAGNLVGETRARHYIAAIHMIRGDLTLALLVLQEAVATAKESGDIRELCGCIGDLGNIYYLQGDEERALQFYKEAVSRSKGTASYSWISGYRSNIGVILSEQGRYEEALVYLNESLTGMREAGDTRNELRIQSNIGRCLCDMGNQMQGIQQLQEAAVAAREWNVPLTEAWSYAYMGYCQMSRGDLVAAGRAFENAAAITTANRFYEIQEAVLLGRSRLLQIRGAREQALVLLREAIEVTESIRNRSRGVSPIQSSYFSQGISIYEEAIRLMWELNTTEAEVGNGWAHEAFALAQRSRARSFLDLLAETEVDLRPHADPTYRQREQEILTRIGELLESSAASRSQSDPDAQNRIELEISNLENNLMALEEELRLADPAYANLKYPQPIFLPEVQERLLADDELLLEYMLGDSLSFLWAITRDQVRWVPLPAKKQIENEVGAFLPLLTDFNLLGNNAAYYLAPAKQLSEMLLEPVIDLIRTHRQVVVAPGGILNYLPFEALLSEPVTTPAAQVTFADLPYLVKSAVVTYIPSVSSLRRLAGSAPGESAAGEDESRSEYSPGKILLLGNPTAPAPEEISIFARRPSGARPRSLSFALRELKNIASLFPAHLVTLKSQESATPQALREAGADDHHLIHVAAHGLFNEARPQYSGLLLTADAKNNSDGFLTAEEVFGMNLPCRQIVLSACSSALGQNINGEGMTGFIRAFLYAGAASVVASLWEVEGETTADFMNDFYFNLTRGGSEPDRAAALTAAKRKLIRQENDRLTTAHPYFWAPFILTGARL